MLPRSKLFEGRKIRQYTAMTIRQVATAYSHFAAVRWRANNVIPSIYFQMTLRQILLTFAAALSGLPLISSRSTLIAGVIAETGEIVALLQEWIARLLILLRAKIKRCQALPL